MHAFSSVSLLVERYHQKQRQDCPHNSAPKIFDLLQLSFAGYNRAGKFGYKILTPGKVQVPGFTEADTHQQVTMRGAKRLRIDRPIDQLSLLISSSLVKDTPLPSGKPWTLGNYIQ